MKGPERSSKRIGADLCLIMTYVIADPACLAAVTEATGHGHPFSEAELAGLHVLTVTGARTLDGLQACSGLKHLQIVGSEIADLRVCEGMPHLVHLQIIATRIGVTTGIQACEALECVDLLYTSLTSAADLLSLKGLRRGTLVGNPWDDQSWQDLQAVAASGLLIDLPTDYDCKLTRRLLEEHGLCWGPIAGVMSMAVQPGLPTFTTNAYDALSLSVIDHELRLPGFSVSKLFQEYAQQITCPDLAERATFRTLGRAEKVLGWIADSPFSGGDKAMLSRFVRRFPSVTFSFASEALIDLETAYDQYVLPGWYLDLRRTLDAWLPKPPFIPVRFAERGHWSYAGRAYYLALYGHGADEEKALLAAGFVNVGLAVDDPRAWLAMRLNDEDRQIYAYDILEASRAIHEGRDPSTCFTPVIGSYFELLDQIVALLPADQEPILAVEI